MPEYTIEFYKTEQLKSPVEDFIEKLNPSAYAKTLRMLSLLQLKGSNLGMPYSRALGRGLFELRVHDKQEVRLFYIFQIGRRIVVLHSFQKKAQKTPDSELRIARDRQKLLT